MKFSKTTIYILIGAVVLIGVLAWVYSSQKKKSPAVPASTGGSPGSSYPLMKGSTGDKVKYLQSALNGMNPGNQISEDGVFQDETYNALISSFGASYYPVSEEAYNDILQKAGLSESLGVGMAITDAVNEVMGYF